VFQEGRIDSTMATDAVGWLNGSDNGICKVTEWRHGTFYVCGNDDDMVADSVYLCGPPGMPEAILKILLESDERR
jgi:hypothetical protein